MEQEFPFDKVLLEQTLRDLITTKKSIENGSSLFQNLCRQGYITQCIETWSDIFKEKKDMGIEKSCISLLYIFNDIIQKYRDEQVVEAFKPALEDMVDGLIMSPLNKAKQEAQKIFKIHLQKKLMDSDFIDNLNQKLTEGKSEQIPENLPVPPSEYLKLVDNEKDYIKYKQLYEENQDQIEYKEKMNKYGQLYLKSYKEIIQSLDKSHMKSVSEYKLVQQKIQKIQGILKAREEDPSLLKKLPQTVQITRQNSQGFQNQQQQELQEPNEHSNGNFNQNEGWNQ